MSIFPYLFSPQGRFRRVDLIFVWLVGVLFPYIWASTTVFYHTATKTPFNFQKAANLVKTTEIKPDARAIMEGSSSRADFVGDFLYEAFIGGTIEFIKLAPVLSLMSIFFYIALIMATIKRFHDLGDSGWQAAHIFFPFHFLLPALAFMFLFPPLSAFIMVAWGLFCLYLIIKLVFIRGRDEDSSYGYSPYYDDHAPTQKHLVIMFVCVALLCGGLFAATSNMRTQVKSAGVMRNTPQATFENIKAAAEKGDPQAQYDLSFFYATGANNVQPDSLKTLDWLNRAARQGNLPAQYNLGIFYATGQYGRPVDFQRAYFWLTRAQMDGYVPSEEEDYLGMAAKKLSPKQIETIEKQAQEWKPVREQVKAQQPAAQPVK